MRSKKLTFVLFFAFTTTLSFGQEAPIDDVRYGHYVLPAIGGSTAGLLIGTFGAAAYWRDDGCHGNADCIDLTGLAAVAVGYVVSVAGGVVGATLAGRDKLRISLVGMFGQYATVGGLYYLADSSNNNDFLISIFAIYVLTNPFSTALYAYLIDRSYVKRKSRVQLQPVVSVAMNRISYGFSLRF